MERAQQQIQRQQVRGPRIRSRREPSNIAAILERGALGALAAIFAVALVIAANAMIR
jgi:hypothetical protein